MEFFGIGLPELLLILVVALIIFGPGKLPEIGAGIGNALREFRRYSSELSRDFTKEITKEIEAKDGERPAEAGTQEGGKT